MRDRQTIRVEVTSDEGPYLPGTAHVYLNGRCVAHLRSGEQATFYVAPPEITSTSINP